jgi:hypothetical protein
MRKALAFLLAAACMLPIGGHAGTVANPEVTDPAGDAFFPTVQGLNADWADITRVWFTTLRSTDGRVSGFEVHLSTLGNAEAPEEDATYTVSWTVGDTCFADVSMSRTDWDGWGSAGAWITYGCEADGETIEVAGNPVFSRNPLSMAVGLGFRDLGTEIVAPVPLTAFFQGASAGLYAPSTKLEHISAKSTAMLDAPDGTPLAYGVHPTDETGCGPVQVGIGCPAGTPYVIGS